MATEDDDIAFNFEHWINTHNLNALKQVFIDHNMMTLNSLTMGSSDFAELMADKRLLNTPHLIQHIVPAIQSLTNIPKPSDSASKKLVFMTQKENEAFITMKEYLDSLNNLEDELTNLNKEYQNKKTQIDKMKQDHKIKNQKELISMKTIIDKTFKELHIILNEKQNKLENKINNLLSELNEQHDDEDNKEEKDDIVNIKYSECLNIINEDKIYYKRSIQKYKEIINKYDDDNNDDFDIPVTNENRQNEIIEVGNIAQKYNENRMNLLSKNKNEMNRMIESNLKLDFVESEEKISLHVDEFLYNEIVKDIDSLIMLNQNDSTQKQQCGNDNKEYEFSTHKYESVELSSNLKYATNKQSNYGAVYVSHYFGKKNEKVSFKLHDITNSWFNLMIGMSICTDIQQLPIDLETKHFGGANNRNGFGIQFHTEHPNYVFNHRNGGDSTVGWSGYPFKDNDIIDVYIITDYQKLIIDHNTVTITTYNLALLETQQHFVLGFRFANDGNGLYSIEII